MRINFGDVVLISYRNFNDKLTPAMFVVCYHGCEDYRGSTIFHGIKVSTEPRGFQLLLLKNLLPFLDHDSYLNCNEQHTFTEEAVIKIVGKLNPYYINKMLQQMGNCLDRSKAQGGNMIGENNLFECNKPQIFKTKNKFMFLN